MVPIFCRTSYLKGGKVGYLHTASGDTPALEYRRLCSPISKLVTSRFFRKWCNSGVVSAFSLRETLDFTGFSGTFQDTDVTDNNVLTSVKAETITVNENMNPDTEYTLEYTVGADDGPNNGLYLYVSYQFYNLPSGNTTTIKDPLGDVYGGVSFYEPSGFLFGSGDGSKIEDYNLFFVRDIEETTLVNHWTQTGIADDRGVNAGFATFNIIKSTAPEDYQQLDKTLGYLQSCIDGELSEDNAIRFQIQSELAITSSSDTSE